ncbi:NAD-dependent epimerase/dehydratase family protein [Medicago truncatula]|uniref:NAD-dependent epimerase/dehydratase family protein n=1 Tax=Medicago truncatula TaxID=3880 RepID=A2Q3Y0_MEDTR|nr:hypothetical protein MtrDRAFT_AC155890g23v2 [Medicago truncatula]KEH23317.1 NAD-dependent epimerase/dehydratase family protein [Medicago truncatula]
MEEGKGRVCVTGGTGFLGSWIIKRLLEDGYTVNATVRDDPGFKLSCLHTLWFFMLERAFMLAALFRELGT